MNQKINSITTGGKRQICEPLIPEMNGGRVFTKIYKGKTIIHSYVKEVKGGLYDTFCKSVPNRSELGPNSRSDKKISSVIHRISPSILLIKDTNQNNDSMSPINLKANEVDIRKEANMQ